MTAPCYLLIGQLQKEKHKTMNDYITESIELRSTLEEVIIDAYKLSDDSWEVKYGEGTQFMDVIMAHVRQELQAIAEKTREDTVRDTKIWWMQSIVDNLGYVLLEGHGGGNWRRLIITLKEDFEKKLAKLSDKKK